MRTYPENRDVEVRLVSRRAYYHRNKVRINDNIRKKRGEFYVSCESRIDRLVDLSKKPVIELLHLLDNETSTKERNILANMIRNAKI